MNAVQNPVDQEQLSFALFILASPVGVDITRLTPEDHESIRSLPENLRRLLWSEKTSGNLYVMGSESGLADEQISGLARIFRDIVLGDIGASGLEETISTRLGLSEEKARRLATRLNKEFIAPNYFQIAQVYEKKRGPKSASDREQEARTMDTPASDFSSTPRANPTKPPSPASTSPLPSPTTSRPAPPRVIDLRSSSIPSRLPPPPAPLPGTKDIAPRPAPTSPPPPKPAVPPGIPLEQLTPMPPP